MLEFLVIPARWIKAFLVCRHKKGLPREPFRYCLRTVCLDDVVFQDSHCSGTIVVGITSIVVDLVEFEVHRGLATQAQGVTQSCAQTILVSCINAQSFDVNVETHDAGVNQEAAVVVLRLCTNTQ